MRARDYGVRSVLVTSLCELKAYAKFRSLAECTSLLSLECWLLYDMELRTRFLRQVATLVVVSTVGCIGELLTYRSCGPLWRDLAYWSDHHAGEMLAHAAAGGGVASELLSDSGCGEE